LWRAEACTRNKIFTPGTKPIISPPEVAFNLETHGRRCGAP
jgi:hypothetical protein